MVECCGIDEGLSMLEALDVIFISNIFLQTVKHAVRLTTANFAQVAF